MAERLLEPQKRFSLFLNNIPPVFPGLGKRNNFFPNPKRWSPPVGPFRTKQGNLSGKIGGGNSGNQPFQVVNPFWDTKGLRGPLSPKNISNFPIKAHFPKPLAFGKIMGRNIFKGYLVQKGGRPFNLGGPFRGFWDMVPRP